MVDSTPELLKGPPTFVATGEAPALRGAATWRTPHRWPTPDLSATGWLIAAALVAWITVCVILVQMYSLQRPLGDTDDAMRLVIVRDLIAGRGWYDQIVPRVQPPQGAWLHWSRLLDGGLAGTVALLRPFVGQATAEWAMRDFWPLAWILPAVASALLVARNLGSRSAVFLTALLLVFNTQLYRQFTPGRIDHHNIQITMTVMALACVLATRNRARWAALGGVATGLGLAVGLEALAFQALIGAAYALELARDRTAARPAAAYGLTLALSAVVFMAVQTPPWRWSMSFCDALSLNLVAGLAAAGLGLALTGAVAGRAPAWVRLALLAATGAAAVAAYLGLDPRCLQGPFAEMDSRVRPFWFDHIQEVQALPRMLTLAHLAAVIAIVMTALGLGASIFLLARERSRPRTGTLLVGACLVVAAITAYLTWRMQDYVFWIGMPVLGAAGGVLADGWLKGRIIPSVALAALLSPALIGSAYDSVADTVGKPVKAPPSPGPRCFSPSAYATLATLPKGVVLSAPDSGPYVLAFTHHSVVVAPYHRLSLKILAAHQAFNAPPSLAEPRVRALGADYVVDCATYPVFLDAGSFGLRLRKGPAPAWLQTLSKPGAALTIYRVRAPAEITGR